MLDFETLWKIYKNHYNNTKTGCNFFITKTISFPQDISNIIKKDAAADSRLIMRAKDLHESNISSPVFEPRQPSLSSFGPDFAIDRYVSCLLMIIMVVEL